MGPEVLPFYKLLSNARPENYTSSSKALHCILPTSGVDEFSRAQLALTSLPTLLPNKHSQVTLFLEGSSNKQPEGPLYLVLEHIVFFNILFSSHIKNRSWAINGLRIVMQLLQKLFINTCPLKLAVKVSCGLVSAGISNSAMSSLFWNLFRSSACPTLLEFIVAFLRDTKQTCIRYSRH